MTNERNYGIDLLRMFSMFLVVMLHVLGCGGVLDATEAGSAAHYLAWGLEGAAFCAVNCYGLISGYVMWNRKGSAGKLLSLWTSVFFWSVVGTIVVLAMGKLPADTNMLPIWSRAFFPVTNGQYWYISAYFLLYLLMPALQAALAHLSRATLTAMAAGAFLLVSVGAQIAGTDAFAMGGGYSAIWLALCFFWGGYIAKYNLLARMRGWWGAVLWVCAALVVIGTKIVLEQVCAQKYGSIFYLYTSPFMVLAAFGLLLFFAKLRITDDLAKGVIKFLSPAALGVYLVHTHSLVFSYIIGGCAEHFAAYSIPWMVFAVISASFVIYLICTALELLRIYLFRLLRVPRLCTWVDKKTTALSAWFEAKFADTKTE